MIPNTKKKYLWLKRGIWGDHFNGNIVLGQQKLKEEKEYQGQSKWIARLLLVDFFLAGFLWPHWFPRKRKQLQKFLFFFPRKALRKGFKTIQILLNCSFSLQRNSQKNKFILKGTFAISHLIGYISPNKILSDFFLTFFPN